MEALKLVVDYATLGILGVMSVIAFAYGIERFFYYRSVNLESYETKNRAEAELSKNLTTISVIGSNAPYVGLLGTVAGIMVVFYEIGQSGGMEPSTVVIGLSLALKATALGLLVAIPSMMIYSACLRKMDLLMGKWEDARA
ncbi:TonB-system energizer ExbB [Sulfuricurvum sp. RIFCSPLOWO2_12_FULL_43_24]|uniref:TonB-system energizer ExbB n=1 Tax=Sulfuricurvum sp. RIFCSPLOWO2_12_FULL_43_24 TaxID=1802247 RepID=UPI0008CC7FB2|nr:TonB-system energizer ExbB [Sulfuricurvum sp. RIFCSPLOWO2_12_FULL_43_24]OHD82039.1 MAG: TonB-system energizer ExbB [Sulfuricurvum sp. RIFCSPHIGHO2_02_FULL_43_9]OHD89397.1 MAG: TonB-system energizer ExbB [Sulfuricurvum sp. RIFCSPLOWO2_12_FULL_43_24]